MYSGARELTRFRVPGDVLSAWVHRETLRTAIPTHVGPMLAIYSHPIRRIHILIKDPRPARPPTCFERVT
eukprot:428513-Prymnesium_polylepis.2